ncbi:Smr/MutS family protein [Candidatus Odyssella acanthamoebae]|uniref:Smr/MutS family protein n=1 Tax=Candidatus Odyssella acanthamoebae TaxID=91604 RepID=UPI000689F094|nr:Smr/MutS family protein [Candidatus Paracaedibacter acanthamoebae]
MKNPPKDSHLWQELIKGIKPLKHRPPHLERPSQPVDAVKINKIRLREYFDRHSHPISAEAHWHNETKKLHKVGKVILEARLDLHGMTREEAHQRLQKFIALAHHDQLTWVLVITGKGHPDNPHTLKKLLPQWLEEMSLATGYSNAKDQHGGQGAYYVRVKSNKPRQN